MADKNSPKGTIIFSTVGRPQYGFDVFSVNLPKILVQSTKPTFSERRLTDGISINFNAQFLDDNQSIVCVSERTGSSRIHLIRAGIPKPQLLPSAPESYFHDRPIVKNGRLYFISAHEPADKLFKSWSALYITELQNDKNIIRLTPKGSVDYSPSISITGKFIAIASYGSRPWSGEFHQLQTDIVVFRQSDPEKRTIVCQHGGWPTWAGDSTIYFHRQADDGWWSIFRIDLPDNFEMSGQSYAPLRITPPGLHCFTPAAMPNSNQIIVATRRRDKNYRHIEIFDVDLHKFYPVTELVNPNFHHYNPFISPDSGFLGYHRFRGESSAGESIMPYLDPVSSPIDGLRMLRINGSFPAFSPAGDLIAYNHGLEADSGVKIVKSDRKGALPLPPVLPPSLKPSSGGPCPPPPGPPPPPTIPSSIKSSPCPPPPPGSGIPPPRPPAIGLKPPHPSPNGPNHPSTSAEQNEADDPKTKLKPFFWDKVLAKPDQSMVWHQIKSGSFQFDEEMIESLFGAPAGKNKKETKKGSLSQDPSTRYIQIIDPKKSHNLSILLKALNVTNEEVCDALHEGNELPSELIETLLKMAPTAEEELKLRLYSGELSRLGTAERFLKVLVEIPFAFKRLESLLFMCSLQEDASIVKESLATFEAACAELKKSRLFLKLLEAVLKTGNRMNVGTFRGGAHAFKLDTLLKLSDVKGADGKTTLLHFVVQEIIRSEGVRATRAARDGLGMHNIDSDDLKGSSHDMEDHYRSLGLEVVLGLGGELENVKKAAGLDADTLTGTVAKISRNLIIAKDFLNSDMRDIGEENSFHRVLKSFVQNAEVDVTWLVEEEKRIMALVKSTADYFHGKAGKDEGLRLFVIVRDFVLILDKSCKEVKDAQKKTNMTPRKEDSMLTPSSGPREAPSPDPFSSSY